MWFWFLGLPWIIWLERTVIIVEEYTYLLASIGLLSTYLRKLFENGTDMYSTIVFWAPHLLPLIPIIWIQIIFLPSAPRKILMCQWSTNGYFGMSLLNWKIVNTNSRKCFSQCTCYSAGGCWIAVNLYWSIKQASEVGSRAFWYCEYVWVGLDPRWLYECLVLNMCSFL